MEEPCEAREETNETNGCFSGSVSPMRSSALQGDRSMGNYLDVAHIIHSDYNGGSSCGGDDAKVETRTSPSSDGTGREESMDRSATPSQSSLQSRVEEDSSGGSKDYSGSELRKKTTRDTAKMRKGKWTTEEEEYTSRIIHYFGLGLLTLPEGMTLRSYLADKLNCDPMRITKKYAGAACLGRKVFYYRDRPQPSIAQIQLVKAELDLLEERFRRRVVDGRPSLPLPQHPFSIPPYGPVQTDASASLGVIPSWLVGVMGSQGTNMLASSAPVPSGPMFSFPAQHPSSVNLPFNLLLRGNGLSMQQQPINGGAFSSPQQPNPLSLTDVLTTLLPSLAPTNSYNAALSSKPALSPSVPPVQGLEAELRARLYAEMLKSVFEQHVASIKANPPAAFDSKPNPVASATKANDYRGKESIQNAARLPEPSRTAEDKADGDILLGFLSSLRKSYEDALREKAASCRKRKTTEEEGDYSSEVESRDPRIRGPVTVTDSSSSIAQPESSVDESDWNSDKKTDPSSSEDSDKDDKDLNHLIAGPLRKRLKKKVLDDMKLLSRHASMR